MSGIGVSVKSAVEHLGSNVDFLQPMFESIVNSLQAKATSIKITLYESGGAFEGVLPTITGFKISDNGEGFTESNIDSFCVLWSDYKYTLGCKGSGRFTWLRVFNNITIESHVKSTGKLVTIPFSLDFSTEDVIKEDISTDFECSTTTIEFTNVTDKYYFPATDNHKGIDKREFADVDLIKEKVLKYLFITFALLKEDGDQFDIEIISSRKSVHITKDDIKELSEVHFELRNDYTEEMVPFTIKYLFEEDGKGDRKIALCSNNRSEHYVNPSSIGVRDKLPNNDSIFIYVTSDYFDEIDTDDRQGLNYYSSKKDSDLVYYIAYSTLLDALQNEISSIFTSKYPKLIDDNELIKSEVRREKPYLSKYLNNDKSIVVTKLSLEKEAMKAFSEDKIETSKKFEKALKEKDIDPEKFIEAINAVSSVSAAELCEYILYRSKILEALSSEKQIGKKEKYLHNLFMNKNTSNSDKLDYITTNLWILDDKFMSYAYACSDINIHKMNQAISDDFARNEHDDRKPDMFVVYDKKTGKRNAVFVEFKRYDAPLYEKLKSITELPNDIGTFRKTNKEINNIYAFVITRIDEDFAEAISNQPGYNKLFTNDENDLMFYSYNPIHNFHLYFCDINAIVNDSKTRNSVFLNIINHSDENT